MAGSESTGRLCSPELRIECRSPNQLLHARRNVRASCRWWRWPWYGKRITIRQLLMMRSGIVDLADFIRDGARYLRRVHDRKLRSQLTAIARRIDTNPAVEVSPLWLIRLAAWQPLLFTPGTQDHYSGIGYELLGLIAARAGAKPPPELYRERIFTPLGLRQTAYDPQGPISGPHARGCLIGANGTAQRGRQRLRR